MQFLSTKQASNQVVPFTTIPEVLQPYLVPGFRYLAYPTDFGMVLTQSLKVREFRLTLHYIVASTDGSFQPTPPEGIHTIHYMYAGNCSAILNGKGPVALTEGEYNRFFVPASRHSAYFLPGAYWCIHLDLLPELFDRYEDELKDFRVRMEHVDPAVGVIFDQEPIKMVNGEREILAAVKASQKAGGAQKRFVYRQCVELFNMYLHEHYKLREQQERVVLSVEQFASLHAARAHMIQHLDRDITVADLAHAYHMNEELFAKGFYQVFAQTVPEFLRYQRLGHAAALLVERDLSIAVIMVMVNYRDRARFDQDLREFYGMTIDELRREFPLNP